jgi:large subunit ribosomal protein L10
MTITRKKKEEIVKEVQPMAEKAQVMIFANFHGLNVADSSKLRRELRKEGVDYKVAKKTLVGKVLDSFGYGGTKPNLGGEVAVIFGYKEPVAPAKIVSVFAKKHEGLKVLGGVFEGMYVDAASIARLATIPSREVLLGQLAQIMNAPARGMVVALNGVMGGFVRALSQIKK